MPDTPAIAKSKVAIVYYSQSGQCERVCAAVKMALDNTTAVVELHRIMPREPYPFPWNIRSFFGVHPEAVLGHDRAIHPLELSGQYGLVIMIWPVWFLSPAPPVATALRSPLLRGMESTPLVSISVCRKMWCEALWDLRHLVAKTRLQLVEHFALCHQGNGWKTLLTTPRSLMSRQSRTQVLRSESSASLSQAEIDRVAAGVETIATRLTKIETSRAGSLPLSAQPAKIHGEFRGKCQQLLAEFVAKKLFRSWASAIVRLSNPAGATRGFLIYILAGLIVSAVICILPVLVVGERLLGSRLTMLVERYTGGDTAKDRWVEAIP